MKNNLTAQLEKLRNFETASLEKPKATPITSQKPPRVEKEKLKLKEKEKENFPPNPNPSHQLSEKDFETPQKPLESVQPSTIQAKNQKTSSPIQSISYPWSEKIREINSKVFKNSNFRATQEEVINSVLLNNDVFVCMPTGGGKSLTFQLPAVLSKGITLVVMPLVSLIFDQINLLTNLGIQVRALNSSISLKDQNQIYEDMLYDPSVKLIFVTPEKLSQSDKLNGYLAKLYQKKRLERIAVDEAHCVSQWGRDFRADYLKLSKFRLSYPAVPIIALTATATSQVRMDICKLLGMRSPEVFLTSFNRPNLTYEVRGKTKKTTEEIANFIKGKGKKSGLIYCISRKDCESLAKVLTENFAIEAGFYHADLPNEKRSEIQQKWMKGEIQVLIATIAFGMGIDKKDCRFVIHFSLPKSIEGYYQESGRAGRDGGQAECILFYSYADKMKQDFLITKSAQSDQQEKSFKELSFVINYCEDIFTCRRKLQLEYLGENFESKECKNTCDNCSSGRKGFVKDLSAEAVHVVNFLQGPRMRVNTLLQVAGLLKGGNLKKNDQIKTHEAFGVLAELSREDIEKMLRKMVQLGVIKEKSVKNFKNVYNTVIEIGPAALSLLQGHVKVSILCECKQPVICIPDNPKIVDLEKLKYPTKPVNSFILTEEQEEELKERIELVVKTLARKKKLCPQSVLSASAISEISKNALESYPNAPKEVTDEVKYFKSTLLLSDPHYTFDNDLCEIDLSQLDPSKKKRKYK